MATLPVIEGHQIHHALKVAAVSLQNSKRDVALLMVAYGTGLMPSEIAKLLLSDCLQASGAPCIESVVRPEIAFNGKARLLLWARGRYALPSTSALSIGLHLGKASLQAMPEGFSPCQG